MKDAMPQIVSALILAVITIFLVNPSEFWMPTMMHMALLGAAVVGFGIFATFVMREQAEDERDELHRMLAGRVAFLAGSAVLLVGILVQSLSHQLDPWLAYALLAMVFAKVGTRLWSLWYC